jgi:hypothetical protein
MQTDHWEAAEKPLEKRFRFERMLSDLFARFMATPSIRSIARSIMP